MENDRNESLAVDTSAVVVSKSKEHQLKRKGITIINTSSGAQKITLAINAEANAGQGIVLSAGGSWSDTEEGGYIPTQKLITAISDIVGGTIAIQERLGDKN